MRLVSQPVQKSRRQVGVSKNLGPVAKAQVRGDNHRTLFMALGKDLEQKFGTFPGERDITQFVL